jgi:RHS repeat-associated protein
MKTFRPSLLRRPSPWTRTIARLALTAVVLADVPIGAFYQRRPQEPPAVATPSAERPAAPAVRVNRTRPKVSKPSLQPAFSATPTTREITAARIFGEPLQPLGDPTPEENRALAVALRAFLARSRGEGEGWQPLLVFLSRFPFSPWRASILANLGALHYRAGYYSRALAMWEQAWLQARGQTDAAGRAVADYAVGEWLQAATKFGKVREINARFEEMKGRDLRGRAAEQAAMAREGVSFLTHLHAEAVFSGPEALKGVLMALRGDAAPIPEAVKSYVPGHAGTSLVDLQELARRSDLPARALARAPGRDIPVPSVVHFRTDHFTAVIARERNGYVLHDPILGGRLWVSAQALEDEMTGYVLVPADVAATGRQVAGPEAAGIVGHCAPGAPGDDPCDECEDSGAGMPVYQFHPVKTSLLLTDTPVGYAPPRGPAVNMTLRYDSREGGQPQTFTYGNVGYGWTLDWTSFVTDNNAMVVAPWAYVSVHLRGQSSEYYTNVTPSAAPHWRSRARLVQVSEDPVRYERRLPDGTVEVFDLPDRGPSAANRRIFLTQITDPQGQSLALTYDAELRLVAITDAIGNVTTLSYTHPTDALKITKITDPYGRFAQLTYTANGQLASITDVLGLTSSFAYDTGDFVSSMTTPYGTTTFRHEPNQSTDLSYRFIEAIDPLGGRERQEFRWVTTAIPSSEPAAKVPAGLSAQNAELDHYNTLYWSKLAMARAPLDVNSAVITNWLIAADLPYGHAWSRNIPHSIKKPLENRVWYRYPGQLASGVHAAGVGRSPTLTARVLDDGSTQAWQATYNDQGRVTSRTDPLGRQTTYAYAANGIDLLEVRQTTGALNDLLASYGDYTTGHLPQTITDAAGESTSLAFTANGQVLTVTNAKNETTTYTYDAGGLGYLQSVVGPVSGAATSYSYDGYGRVRTVTDSDGYVLLTDFDAFDRPTKTTFPDGTFEEIAYDRLDAVRQRDRLGRWTYTTYDALRRVTSTRDPLGRLVQQVWCGCGSLEALIDAKGQKTTWARDVMGRVTSEIRTDGTTTTSYIYEGTTSRLKSMTDPKAQVTTYTYALDDVVLGIAWTNSAIVTPGVSYTYETGYARVTTMVDGVGTTAYGYHAPGTVGAGKIASEDGPLANDVISYVYDELGRVVERSVNGSANRLTLTYDALGRVASETNVLGTFTLAYDGFTSRVASVLYPNGQTSTYAYHPNSQDHHLQTIHHKYPGGATLSKFDYTHDAVGNILTWQQQVDNNPAAVWVYGYDKADQLTRAVKQTSGATPTVLDRYSYGYDSAGNRTFEQVNDAVTGWTHDSLNRLATQVGGGQLRFAGTVSEPATVTVSGVSASVSGANAFEAAVPVATGTPQVTITAMDPNGNTAAATYEVEVAANGKSFSYDANGNLTSDGTRTFEWDARNQLTAVAVGTFRTEFTYDGAQRRARVIEKENGSLVSSTDVIWCSSNICEERSTGGSVAIRAYTFGEERSATPHYFTLDHIGSVTAVTSSSGVVLGRYEYDPWGRQQTIAGASTTDVGFTGHRRHQRSGTWLSLYRAYGPDTGWLSEDPLRFVVGPNFYSYVDNSPIDTVDPLGLAKRKGGVPKTRVRPCERSEWAICEIRCFPNAVKTCSVVEIKKLMQANEGLKTYVWVPRPPDCNCEEERPKPRCEACEKVPVWVLMLGAIVWMCLTRTPAPI